MRILIVHAIGLEFGWELMKFQAKIRYLSRLYDRTFVFAKEDVMFFYRDFASELHNFHDYIYENKLKPDMWRYEGAQIDYVYPTKEFCCSAGNEEFIRYGYNQIKDRVPAIVIHPRKKSDNREWGKEKWNEFVELIRTSFVANIYVIGKIGQTHNVRGVTDYRESSIGNVCHLLENANLCVGPSSGPMHLASLCSCPHLVWSDKKRWNLGDRKGTNRERYETYWNPFNTPVTVVDSHGWNPPVELIANKGKEILS